MIFVETPTFTRRVLRLLDDESYGALQTHLAKRPDAGDVIRGGGVRVIYYWWMGKDRISMLFIYPKNEMDDLSAEQLKLLRQALEP